MFALNKHHTIQKLLGHSLPESATDLHYYRWQPGADLAYYVVYIKFRVTREEFVSLISQIGMDLHNKGGAAMLYLPTSWKTMPQVALDWWNPGADTPEDAAAKSFGVNGWIVAKYENNYAYFIVSDTGRTDASN